MKKTMWLLFIFFPCLFSLTEDLKAQPQANPSPVVSPAMTTPTAPATPQPAATASVTESGESTTAPSSEQEAGNEESDEYGKPFVPHWSGQLGFTYSNQPNQLAQQGQVEKELGLTGTYNITESGHYFAVGITGGQQLVEGADTNYGQVSLEGGLGLGFFHPSLNAVIQEGASALNSYSGTLTLNFQVFDPLEAGLTLGGGLESHQGPVSQIGLGTADTVVEIDDSDWNTGVVLDFTPWDFLSFSLTGQVEFDLTYQYQNLTHTTKLSFNQPYQTPSLTLAAEATFWKDFVLEPSLQVGQEIYPAGTFYSKAAAKTVTFSQPTTSNFTGFSVGLMYNFE